MINEMAEQWFIRVEGREYGPADLATLQEWKGDDRVLATNEARRSDESFWTTAANIPGLFGIELPPGQEPPPLPPIEPSRPDDEPQMIEPEAADVFESASAAVPEYAPGTPLLAEPATAAAEPRPLGWILVETIRIFFTSPFKFAGLTLLVVAPSLCAEFIAPFVRAAPTVDTDMRTLVAGGLAFCMALLGLALTPVYIAGIQVLTAARAAGERIGFLALVNDAVRYWPRVTFLWLFVIVCYAFWTVLPVGFAGALAIGGPSYLSILLALVLLGVQVWVTGRLFVNFLFWQQFAVLEGCDVGESLRRSKELARSRQDIRWYRRPMWRGIFIASLWFAFVFVLNWPSVDSVFRTIYSTPDPAAMAEALRKTAEQISQSQWTFVVNLIQAFCKPLLGIAFVLLFLESNSSRG